MPADASASKAHPAATPVAAPAPTQHRRLVAWVDEIARLTEPSQIHWCDGSEAEYDRMFELMLATGTAERLDQPTGVQNHQR